MSVSRYRWRPDEAGRAGRPEDDREPSAQRNRRHRGGRIAAGAGGGGSPLARRRPRGTGDPVRHRDRFHPGYGRPSQSGTGDGAAARPGSRPRGAGSGPTDRGHPTLRDRHSAGMVAPGRRTGGRFRVDGLDARPDPRPPRRTRSGRGRNARNGHTGRTRPVVGGSRPCRRHPVPATHATPSPGRYRHGPGRRRRCSPRAW